MFEPKNHDNGETREAGAAGGERLRPEHRKDEHRTERMAGWEGYDADILGALDP